MEEICYRDCVHKRKNLCYYERLYNRNAKPRRVKVGEPCLFPESLDVNRVFNVSLSVVLAGDFGRHPKRPRCRG